MAIEHEQKQGKIQQISWFNDKKEHNMLPFHIVH